MSFFELMNIKHMFYVLSMNRANLIAIISLSTLTGCWAGIPVPVETTAPTSLTEVRYVEVPTGPVVPPRVVEIPVPAATPLNDKIRPRELLPYRPHKHPTKRSLKAAVDQATVDPHEGRFNNGHQIYSYAEGQFYTVFAVPERIVDIQLQPGEELLSANLGDSFRWLYQATQSGAGETARTHVFFKPTEEEISTNLVLTTTKRAYHIELISDPANVPHHSVSWSYPGEQRRDFSRQIAEMYAPGRASHNQPGGGQEGRFTVLGSASESADDALAKLNFNWAIEGGDGQEWLPTEVYDDGARVVLRFAPVMARKQMPVLSLLTAENQVEIVNYIQQGSALIVPYMFDRAVLYMSRDPAQRVFIARTGIWTQGE
ncbi:TrbG/VirB9 family P-type conjugative transfer protein [Nisaea sediminum]|uniref:TrbG/VirB9 family P-type conjugative transfer protein n=3 Tax=Pseudomonadota TaxID=1224 RepID=UPI001865E639|nr:TrbG/VirB9 family P-type conjugative transfer protein [Nisaea sediminum]